MNIMTKSIAILGLLATAAFAQVATTTTTLSAALLGPTSSNSAPTTVCVASSTGISAPGFGNPAVTALMVDKEYMPVLAATPSTTCWSVLRGGSGTAAFAHASGATVYVGATGGFSGSPFRNLSPQGGSGSPCTATNEAYLPQVVVGGSGHDDQIGQVWNCISAVTGVQATTTGFWYPTNAPEVGPALTDFEIFVPAGDMCSATITTGTAGTGNNTVVLAGAVPALKAISTAAAAEHNIDCNLTAGLRTTSGKGITLTSMSVIYGIVTTTATSMATPTISLFNAPVASTSETASSATLVTTAALVGGTLTMTPAVASANLTAVTAGQFYTENIALGTPIVMNSDLRTYVFHFQTAQSASAAMTTYVAGIWLRGTQIPF